MFDTPERHRRCSGASSGEDRWFGVALTTRLLGEPDMSPKARGNSQVVRTIPIRIACPFPIRKARNGGKSIQRLVQAVPVSNVPEPVQVSSSEILNITAAGARCR